jgi:hypothetical protein
VWPVSDLSSWLQTSDTGLSSSQDDIVARVCLYYTAEAGLDGYNACTTLPIFLSGRSDVPTATDHDIAALQSYPGWVALNYEKGVTKPGRAWFRGSSACANPGANQSCDEYPFFATQQGGSNANPQPSLLNIDASQNSLQGSLYGGFVKACNLATGTPAPDPTVANSTGGSPFLALPLPNQLATSSLSTLRYCNGIAAAVQPADPSVDQW